MLKAVYHVGQQCLMHRILPHPFPPIEAREESLDIHRSQSPAERLEPRRVPAHALRHKPEAVPQEELPRSAHASPPESSPNGGPCP